VKIPESGVKTVEVGMSACSQIVERHRVFSQIKGVAQRARTPLSGKLMPNLLHLGYRWR
jgi:hypothetical protein